MRPNMFLSVEADEKVVFLRHLDGAREGLLWKLEGLSEYDVRRPLTRTGTNLLGIVKHVAMIEWNYLGACFDRAVAEGVPEFDPPEFSDMWARADETRDSILDFYGRVAANTTAVVEDLSLDTRGHVAHWPPERRNPTLQELLVRMVGETSRHAGHADILRESLDGRAGAHPAKTSLPDETDASWAQYRQGLEDVARGFRT
jgi:hypothetical protein